MKIATNLCDLSHRRNVGALTPKNAAAAAIRIIIAKKGKDGGKRFMGGNQ